MPFASRFVDSITAVTAEQWQAVAGTDYPFLRYDFLHALEASGSVGDNTGWQPRHLLIEENGELVAALPLYLKQHSYGEYVFDWSWADAWHRNGIPYYPKLVSAIPFTPATGPRLLYHNADPALLIDYVSKILKDYCEKSGASGWHILFPDVEESALWQQADSHLRIGCQFHWFNKGYQDFDDFLATFSSRKRKNLNKERRRVSEQGVHLQRLTGDAITEEHWRQFYHFYQITYAKRSGHGGYLTGDFFRRLHTMRDQLLLVMACEGKTPIAGALYFFSSTTLYGRYWGAIKDVDQLHFEACYYQGIEFCIEKGLKRFDPGAQGEHKIQRGFEPVLTYSRHWLKHPGFHEAVGRFVTEEADYVRDYQHQAAALLPFKKTDG